MSNILLNFFVNSATNYSSLSEITLSSNLCNFHILFLNNFTDLSADVPPIVTTKYAILNNLSHIIKITSFLTTNRNFVKKSTVKCIYSLFSTLFAINFPTGASVWYFSSNIYYIHLYIFLHLLSSLATSYFLLLTLLSFIFLYVLLLVYYDVTRSFPLSTPYFSIHILFSSLILNLLLSTIHCLSIL